MFLYEAAGDIFTSLTEILLFLLSNLLINAFLSKSIVLFRLKAGAALNFLVNLPEINCGASTTLGSSKSTF